MLGNVLEEASRAVGGKPKVAVGGIGALAGALLGGGKSSIGGALGVSPVIHKPFGHKRSLLSIKRLYGE